MKSKQVIILGADHAGFAMKEKVRKVLDTLKLPYLDYTPALIEGDDYPQVAFKVAKDVASDSSLRGILVCGSGTGMEMAANRVKGARAVAAYDTYSAKYSRLDNNSNILCLRGRKTEFSKTKAIVKTWLATNFSGVARHARRIKQLDSHE